MTHYIVTMSRGDAARIEDWIRFHSALGFEKWIILLDNPIDDSSKILDKLISEGFDIDYRIMEARGDYFDDVPPELLGHTRAQWVENNTELIESLGRPFPVVDPLSWRQYLYLPEILEELSDTDPDSWVSVLDVDEYFCLPDLTTIDQLTRRAETNSLRFLNFNFDTREWDGVGNIREFTKRWDHEGIKAFGRGYERRVKSLTRCAHAHPMASVHGISRTSYVLLDPTRFRLHHYKHPIMEGIAYSVTDHSTAPRREPHLETTGHEATKPQEEADSAANCPRQGHLIPASSFAELRKSLLEFRNDEVIYVYGGGDYGSVAIRWAVEQFLTDIGMKARMIRDTDFNVDELRSDGERSVLLFGGGKISDLNNALLAIIDAIDTQRHQVILLPTSGDTPQEFPAFVEQHPSLTHAWSSVKADLEQIPVNLRDKSGYCPNLLFSLPAYKANADRIWRIMSFRSVPEEFSHLRSHDRCVNFSSMGDASYPNPLPLVQILRNFSQVYCDSLELSVLAMASGAKAYVIAPEDSFTDRVLHCSGLPTNRWDVVHEWNDIARAFGIPVRESESLNDAGDRS